MKHIIFDFDGTLFNSAEGIFDSFEIAAQSIDCQVPNKSHVISNIGPPIQQLIPLIYPNLEPEKTRIMSAKFREHYDKIGYLNSSIYHGVVELLRSLDKDKNIAMISIVTNKPTLPTLKLLIKNRVHKFFDNIIGIDYPRFMNQGTNYSSKANALIELIRPLQSYNSIYIGDTASDRDAALAASCTFVAVSYGFYRWREASRALLKIAGTPSELRSLIDNI